MRLTLLFWLLIFVLHLNAMLKSVDESDDEWVTIMTTQDGVIIDSDPDSGTSLPDISQSYYQPEFDTHPATLNSPRVKKIIQVFDFTTLIRENYPYLPPAQSNEQVKNLSSVKKISIIKK